MENVTVQVAKLQKQPQQHVARTVLYVFLIVRFF